MNLATNAFRLVPVAALLVICGHRVSPVSPADLDRNVSPAVVPWRARTAASERVRTTLARKRANLLREGPKRFDQPKEAHEFFIEQRLATGQTDLPLEHLLAVRRDIEAREQALADRRGSGPGPGGIQGWTSIGPGNVGGRTRAIVIDPNDPDVMYASGVAGGVWKSTNGGGSWNPTDDLMLNLAVCALAMDPNDSNVLYAGTGEGYYGASVFVRGLGIFKSTDAGATWAQLPATINVDPPSAFFYVNKIVISPNDSNTVYAATRSGVWRTPDAGETWSIVLSNPWRIPTPPTTNGCNVGCTDLVVRNDSSPDVLFAAFGSFVQDGLYRSDDGGDNWVGYTTPTNQGRMTLALAPSNNDVLYLVMADNGSGGALGQLVSVFRTNDGGDNFYSCLDFAHPFSPWLMSYVSIALGCYDHPVIYSQGWYDNIVAVDPLDPETVWVGGINLYRSDDGGQTFGLAGYWFNYLADPTPPNYMHPDQHIIAFHPDFDGTTNQTMYVGNDGGLFRTDNAMAATSQEPCPFCPDEEPHCEIGPPPEILWDSANNGYAVTQYYHGDSARDVDVFVGGSQDNGTSRGQAADTPNEWRMIFGGDGGYVAIDPTNDQRMFVEYNGFPNFQRSLDGGDTFEEAINGITDTDGLFIAPFAMDQSDPDIMWTGGSRPWRTVNGADYWELAGPDFAGPTQISAVAIASSDSNVVYLGFTNGYVVRTTNSLDPSPTWSIFVDGLYGGWVSSLAVDHQDPDVAYCTYSNYGIPHVFQTINGGHTWNSIDGVGQQGIPDIPAHWVAVRPCESSQLYVGTELGVFASDDTGSTWNPANNGSAHTVVESLDFKTDNQLVAFTHGRSVFMTTLDPCPCQIRDGDLDQNGTVDVADYAILAGCLEGPASEIPPDGCEACNFSNADLDADGDVDLEDYRWLTTLFGGE